MNIFAERRWLPFLVEIIGGSVAGLIVGLPLVFLAGAVIEPRAGSFDDVIGSIAGLYFGYIVGVTLGVILVGRIMKHLGAWWAALAGSVVGGIIAVLIASLGGGDNASPAWVILIILVPVLSALAYTWTAARS